MKYTVEEGFAEIKRRGRTVRLKREKGKTALMSALSAAAAILLILVISLYSNGTGYTSAPEQYGAFLLPAEAGGYVLTAVIFFAVGVTVTLIIKHYRKDQERKG